MSHKFWTIVIIAILVFAVVEIVKAATPTKTTTTYVIGAVDQGTIISDVTATGQVASSDQIAVPSKSSGQITRVYVTPGDKVTVGQTLAAIDNTTESLSLQQAKNSLAQAKQTYANDQLTQSIAFQNAQINLNSSTVAQPDPKNEDSITPTISGGYNSTEKGIYTITDYTCAQGTCISYTGIETGSVLVTPNIPIQLGTRGLYLNFSTTPKVPDVWTVAVPSPLASNYLSQSQNLTTSQTTNSITLANDQNSIASAELNLQSAEINYQNTLVTAPISGIVGQVSVVKGQTINSGTTVATLVGNGAYADVTLNEVDVAKIALGDKAAATFDAIDGLSLTGKVVSIDQIGTVSQGVVNYDVKIAFDTQDSRVKSGMSVAVTIATQIAQNTIEVPSSAVKSSGGVSYVLTVPTDTTVSTDATGTTLATAPTQTTVTIGISDGTETQILSGLAVGDKVVTKTVTTSSAKTTAATTTPSLFGSTSSRGGATSTRALTGAAGAGR